MSVIVNFLYIPQNIPLQMTSHDCGVFVCMVFAALTCTVNCVLILLLCSLLNVRDSRNPFNSHRYSADFIKFS